jgi:hypothetical protein
VSTPDAIVPIVGFRRWLVPRPADMVGIEPKVEEWGENPGSVVVGGD